jgi:hypothetical protein
MGQVSRLLVAAGRAKVRRQQRDAGRAQAAAGPKQD